MKIIIFENSGNRFQLLSEAVINAGFEPEPGETTEQLSSGGTIAAIVSQELPEWEDIFQSAVELNLPVFVAGKPELETLQFIKNMSKGVQSGIIATYDENLAQEQTKRYLERLSSTNRKGLQRQGLAKKPSVMQEALVVNKSNPTSPSPALKARRMKKKTESDTVRDQIITVYSPKGGVGKSTYAVNLAFALATCTSLNARVILVDLDVSFGNVASILGMPNKANLLNWIRGDFKEDLSDLVHIHPESGLNILMSPPNPVDAGDINYQIVDKMLSILSKRYDFVIIDSNPALRALHKACFEWADTIVLVSTPQKPTLRDIKQMENIFKQMQIQLDKVKLVINEMPKKQSLRIKDAVQEMNYEVIGYIPEDANVKVIENTGGVACLSSKCKDYARAHFDVCNRLLGKKVLEKPKGFNFLGLFKNIRKSGAAF